MESPKDQDAPDVAQPAAGPMPSEAAGSDEAAAVGEEEEEGPEGRKAGTKFVALVLAAVLALGAVFSYRFFFQPSAVPPAQPVSSAWTWSRLSFPPMDPRYGHAAVWTGSRMIIWGGFSGVAAQVRFAGSGIRADGAEYDPQADTWTVVPPGPFFHRPDMPAVWTGSEMVAWGGDPARPALGVAYNPGAKSWRSLPAQPLQTTGGQSGVWTGTEVIIWGGRVALADRPAEQPAVSAAGAAYNPGSNTWREIPAAPIEPRDGHSAVWTGKEMLVWGGAGAPGDAGSRDLPDGGAFDPQANTWRKIPPAPAALVGGATWSGTEMLVWGDRRIISGQSQAEAPRRVRFVMGGLAFNPADNRWRSLPAAPLSLRTGAKAVWSADRLFVWGGLRRSEDRQPSPGPARDGAAYDPAAGRWERLGNAPIEGRDFAFSMLGSGDSVIIWGGKASERGGQGTTLADGARLSRTGQ